MRMKFSHENYMISYEIICNHMRLFQPGHIDHRGPDEILLFYYCWVDIFIEDRHMVCRNFGRYSSSIETTWPDVNKQILGLFYSNAPSAWDPTLFSSSDSHIRWISENCSKSLVIASRSKIRVWSESKKKTNKIHKKNINSTMGCMNRKLPSGRE